MGTCYDGNRPETVIPARRRNPAGAGCAIGDGWPKTASQIPIIWIIGRRSAIQYGLLFSTVWPGAVVVVGGIRTPRSQAAGNVSSLVCLIGVNVFSWSLSLM